MDKSLKSNQFLFMYCSINLQLTEFYVTMVHFLININMILIDQIRFLSDLQASIGSMNDHIHIDAECD